MSSIGQCNTFASIDDNKVAHNEKATGSHGDWRLSPAYDLMCSSGPDGEQSTVLMGEGKAPHLQQLRALGTFADLTKKAVAP